MWSGISTRNTYIHVDVEVCSAKKPTFSTKGTIFALIISNVVNCILI